MFGDIQRVNSIGETKSHSIEIEDCGVAMMKFKSGVMGTLSYTNCVYNKNYEGSITIVGEKGTIRIGGSYLNTIDFWDVQSYPFPTRSTSMTNPTFTPSIREPAPITTR